MTRTPAAAAVLTLPLETPRLILRRLIASDAAAFAAYRSDPAVARYQNWEHCTLDEASAFIRRQRRRAAGAPGQWTQIGLTLRESGALIGDCGVFAHPDARQAAIGITLAQPYQGRGYATESLTALLDHLLLHAGLDRVEADVDPRNRPSWSLLDRLGMRREGHRIQSQWFKGHWADEYLYAILRGEWLARRQPPASA
ncbi:MAG: GNAT family N-acetyltransferase [Dehalococcoidia bacterium]